MSSVVPRGVLVLDAMEFNYPKLLVEHLRYYLIR